jgi:hypothetical protein
MIKKLLFVVVVVVVSVAGAGCGHRSRALYEPGTIVASEYRGDVKQGIRQALFDFGWFVESDRPGEIIARQTKGDIQARVKVLYSGRKITVKYLDSMNLNYSNEEGFETIHSRYNTWVRNLEKRIYQLLG